MRILLLSSLLLVGLFQAQNQRFQYEYRQVPDSTQVADVQTEIMDLEVTSKGSTFLAEITINVILFAKLSMKNKFKQQELLISKLLLMIKSL